MDKKELIERGMPIGEEILDLLLNRKPEDPIVLITALYRLSVILAVSFGIPEEDIRKIHDLLPELYQSALKQKEETLFPRPSEKN